MAAKLISLSRDEILRADDLKRVPVEVPEWGGRVYVRSLTALEVGTLQALTEAAERGSTLPTLMQRVVCMACVDAEGRQLFQATDIEALSAKCGAVVQKVFNAAAELNGMQGVEHNAGN